MAPFSTVVVSHCCRSSLLSSIERRRTSAGRGMRSHKHATAATLRTVRDVGSATEQGLSEGETPRFRCRPETVTEVVQRMELVETRERGPGAGVEPARGRGEAAAWCC